MFKRFMFYQQIHYVNKCVDFVFPCGIFLSSWHTISIENQCFLLISLLRVFTVSKTYLYLQSKMIQYSSENRLYLLCCGCVYSGKPCITEARRNWMFITNFVILYIIFNTPMNDPTNMKEGFYMEEFFFSNQVMKPP